MRIQSLRTSRPTIKEGKICVYSGQFYDKTPFYRKLYKRSFLRKLAYKNGTFKTYFCKTIWL